MFLRRLNSIYANKVIASGRINLTGTSNITTNKLWYRAASNGNSSTISLLDKWRTKFSNEKVPEVESSIENILAHVVDEKQVI